MQRTRFACLAAVALTRCAAVQAEHIQSPDDPSNPHAAEAPAPSPSKTLARGPELPPPAAAKEKAR